MRRIAIINQKGGVGKTTTTVNLGSALARMGHRVLLIDLDPQAHLTLYLGQDPTSGQPGVYEMLTDSATVAKVRRKIGSNLWVCSASIDLAGAEVELVSVVGREVILRDLLDQHINSNKTPPYDYVLMDCPPSLNVLTLNALCASSEVIIPLQPHYLALQGLSKLLETVAVVSKRINAALKVTGVVVCMNEAGTKLAGEVVDDVRSFFEEARGKNVPWDATRVFRAVIRRNIKLAESPSYGKSIFDYAPDSNGAEDYHQLAAEVHSPNALPVQALVEEPVARTPNTAHSPRADLASEPVPNSAAPAVRQKVKSSPAGAAKPDGQVQAPPALTEITAKTAEAKPLRQERAEKSGIDPALAEPVRPKLPTSGPRRQRATAIPAKPCPATVEQPGASQSKPSRKSVTKPSALIEPAPSKTTDRKPVATVDRQPDNPKKTGTGEKPATAAVATGEAAAVAGDKTAKPARTKPRAGDLPAAPVVQESLPIDPVAVVPAVPQTA